MTGRRDFGGRAGGVGRMPALVVVDMSYGFTDPASPLACDVTAALLAIAELLEAARRADVPVVYTTVSYGEAEKRIAEAFIAKAPALRTLATGTRWVEIDDRLAPREHDPVMNKLFASAFFGTALASTLAAHGCDSVIICGASTSGCVRATVVDALQYGYRPIVPREAVADRNPAAHDAALCDIDLKYGDVTSLVECLDALGELVAAHAR
jgi:maleamate amidohydrolase